MRALRRLRPVPHRAAAHHVGAAHTGSIVTAHGAGLRHRLDRARPRRRPARRRHRPAARADHPRADVRRAGPAGAEASRCGSGRSIPVVRGDISSRSSGPTSTSRPWRDLPAWPGPAISDDEGRFTLRGLEPGLELPAPHRRPAIRLRPTIAPDRRHRPRPGRLTARVRDDQGRSRPGARSRSRSPLQPARTIVGRVTYADTGRPVPHALVAVDQVRYEADAEGRFRIPVIATLPARRRSLRDPGPVARRRALPDRREAGRMAQGGGRAVGRPRPAPGRGRPRQDDRGGHGPARRRRGRAVIPPSYPADPPPGHGRFPR